MPSPAPTPRLSQPQQIRSLTCGMSELYSQIFFPFLASSAKISSLPVGMYITPSMTIGSGSNRYFEPGHPRTLEVRDIGRIDCVQRRVALVVDRAPKRDPVFAARFGRSKLLLSRPNRRRGLSKTAAW